MPDLRRQLPGSTRPFTRLKHGQLLPDTTGYQYIPSIALFSLLCDMASDSPTVSGSAPARMGESNPSNPTMTIPGTDTATRSSCSLLITAHVGEHIPAYLTRNTCHSIHQPTGIRALRWDHGRSTRAIDFFIVSRRPLQVNSSLPLPRRLATPRGFESDTYASVTKLATAVLCFTSTGPSNGTRLAPTRVQNHLQAPNESGQS